MSTLTVREVFPTIQGEGSAMGTPAVFLRLSGCNLWSGRAPGRLTGRGVCAQWCDTDFVGGDKWKPAELTEKILGMMKGWHAPTVVVTGGEPLLQLKRKPGRDLVRRLRGRGVRLHLETNGTVNAEVIQEFDHVTVSPKAIRTEDTPLQALDHIVVRKGTDLKVVHPQWTLLNLSRMEGWEFDHRYVQPLDGGSGLNTWDQDHLESTVRVTRTMGWKLSPQVHKLMGWR